MAIITIPTNFGPAAGEQYVSFPIRSYQFTDGSYVTGTGLFDQNGVGLDVEMMNLAMTMLAQDEEDVDATPDMDGVVNYGVSAGYK